MGDNRCLSRAGSDPTSHKGDRSVVWALVLAIRVPQIGSTRKRPKHGTAPGVCVCLPQTASPSCDYRRTATRQKYTSPARCIRYVRGLGQRGRGKNTHSDVILRKRHANSVLDGCWRQSWKSPPRSVRLAVSPNMNRSAP